ncbi:hypothetical protein [Halospina denitrificans]|uniref:hypothetical protein n=1 Tax=Halospina denitrificans TaxID=332522 RepID=UPI00106049AB|nr:hypothetical protein [Halospina denitrificans]
MKTGDFEFSVFLSFSGLIVLSTVIYGLATGDIVTVGGGRYSADIIWLSSDNESDRFWFAVCFHLFIAGFCAYQAVQTAKGKD